MKQGVRAVILAGGQGTRLCPLTGTDPIRDRPKPNVPFEKRRLIDFPISGCLHSTSVDDIHVLAQAHPNKIINHIQSTYLTHEVNGKVRAQVAPMITGKEFFAGTFDAVRQSRYLIDSCHENILVLSGDHLYKMIYDELVKHHQATDADVTVVVKRVPATEAGEFGVFALSPSGTVIDFVEKPDRKNILVPTIDDADNSLVSLGIYLVKTSALKRLFAECEGDDFGHNVIPFVLGSQDYKLSLFEYDGYWRDVGSIKSLWQANMDIIGPKPSLNLYDLRHPIYHLPKHLPSPKFINGCQIQDSIVSDGCIIGGRIFSSVFSSRIRVGCNTQISESVLFDQVKVGHNARLHRVIADKHVQIGDGVVLGENPEQDILNWPEQLVLRDGIIVVTRGAIIGNPPQF